MMRTRNYTMQEGVNEPGQKEVYVIAADRDWWDKYSGWVSLGLLILGFLLGLISDPIKSAISPTQSTNSDTVSVKVLSLPQQQALKSDQYDAQQIPKPLKKDSAKHN
jgi:hypothetical protein